MRASKCRLKGASPSCKPLSQGSQRWILMRRCSAPAAEAGRTQNVARCALHVGTPCISITGHDELRSGTAVGEVTATVPSVHCCAVRVVRNSLLSTRAHVQHVNPKHIPMKCLVQLIDAWGFLEPRASLRPHSHIMLAPPCRPRRWTWCTPGSPRTRRVAQPALSSFSTQLPRRMARWRRRAARRCCEHLLLTRRRWAGCSPQ